jgi:hypothetical protein
MKRPKVRFVYRRSARYLGSTVLRADQLCRLAQRHLGDRYDFATLSIPRMTQRWRQSLWVKMREEAIYIFVKDAVDRLDREHLAELKRKSIAIGVDYVDRSLAALRPDSVDLHISASVAGRAALKSLVAASDDSDKPAGAATALLLHNTDERLESLRFRQMDQARVVYFGGPGNTVLTDYARSVVDVVSAELSNDMTANFRRLEGYNAHYCVRPDEDETNLRRRFKPFTKGFTAAACGANVIVNCSVDDAVAFLGVDYPFLIRRATKNDIDEGLQRLVDAFGSADWARAQSTMAAIRERVKPPAIAGDFDQLLTALLH